MNTKPWVRLGGAALVLLACAGTALADTYMKQVRRTEAFQVMGQKQPAKSETVEIWLGEEATRIDNADGTSTLVVPGQQRIYFLKHAERSCAAMPLDMNQALDEMMAAGEEDAAEGEDAGDAEDSRAAAAAMREMMSSMMKFQVKLEDTGEQQKVGRWNARKYLMSTQMGMGSSTSELWATEELEADMAGYWKAANASMAGQGGFADMIREMEKIRGVVVRTVSRSQVMGAQVSSTEELVEFATRDAPKGTFTLPAGYREVPMFGE